MTTALATDRTDTRATTCARVVHIPLGSIDDNPWQPSGLMDIGELKELAESIHQHGLLQSPIGRASPTAT